VGYDGHERHVHDRRQLVTTAKAIAGAVTALAVFLIAHLGLEFPVEVTAALETLVTAGVVYLVPNKETADAG
jgi:hypothetical protein